MVQQAPDDVGWDTWLEPSSLHALMSSPVHQPLLAAVLTWLHGRLVENAAFRDVTFGIVPVTFLGLGRYVVIGLRVPAGRDPEKIRKEVEAHVDELVARATLREFLDVAARIHVLVDGEAERCPVCGYDGDWPVRIVVVGDTLVRASSVAVDTTDLPEGFVVIDP